MTGDKLKRNIKAMKRAADKNLGAISYKQAVYRHDLRGVAIRQIFLANMEDDLKMQRDGDPFDPGNPDHVKATMLRIDDLRCQLGDDGLKQWRDDHFKIVRAHSRMHGNFEKLLRCSAFGVTPEAMYAHQAGRFCEGVHEQLSKKEKKRFRNEIRCGLKRASLEPLKLHPASGEAKGKFFDPEFVVGIRDFAFRFQYPIEDFPGYDAEKTYHYGEPQ